MKKIIIALLIITVAASCTKKNEQENAVLQLKLTDAPGAFEGILIDIKDVQYNLERDSAEGEWISLDLVISGIYNLLDFTNGIDTLLGEASIEPGRITQMRLILGNGNKVIKDGEIYDIKTPSAQTSGLKFLVNKDLQPGITYTFWIDIDADRSVVSRGNGEFLLKPVIRVYNKAGSGSISGIISPAECNAYVMSISSGNDTTGTYADTLSGKFLLAGLAEGSYRVEVIPDEGYEPAIIDDVVTELGKVTMLDTIFISVTP